MNIIDYVSEKGYDTFEERPFSEVDSLVLSQLAYLKYDNFMLESGEGMTFDELYSLENRDDLFNHLRAPGLNLNLIHAVSKSRRYRDVKISYYREVFDEETETQFAAVTFVIKDLFAYVAFRGTDDTFVGWKEDLNLAFMSEVPSQTEAKKYLEYVAKRYVGDIVVGGHSKGGNLAVYASFSAKEEVRARILAVYNHDGPGFLREVFENENYKAIKGIIYKTVPRSSLIGMLLEQHEAYRVIDSDKHGIMQHDPFSWVVEGTEFVTLESLSPGSLYIDDTMKDWFSNLPRKDRQTVINTLFRIIGETNEGCFVSLKDNLMKHTAKMLRSARDLTPEMKKVLKSTVSSFIKSAGREAWKRVQLPEKNDTK